jgi:starvation-inducible DNA-binding protein
MAAATVTAISLDQALRAMQADYAIFYQKLRAYHWTVCGPQFFLLHELFEKLYHEAADTQDSLAERLVTLGLPPAKTLREQLTAARLKEDATTPDATAMVRNVLSDLSSLHQSLRELAGEASRLSDTATLNLADDIADRNEKTAWMLRALLSKESKSAGRPETGLVAEEVEQWPTPRL